MTKRFHRSDLVQIGNVDASDPEARGLLDFVGTKGRLLEDQDPDEPYRLLLVQLDDGRQAECWPDELIDITPDPQLPLFASPEAAL